MPQCLAQWVRLGSYSLFYPPLPERYKHKARADKQVFVGKFSLTSFICPCVREKISNFP